VNVEKRLNVTRSSLFKGYGFCYINNKKRAFHGVIGVSTLNRTLIIRMSSYIHHLSDRRKSEAWSERSQVSLRLFNENRSNRMSRAIIILMLRIVISLNPIAAQLRKLGCACSKPSKASARFLFLPFSINILERMAFYRARQQGRTERMFQRAEYLFL